MKTKSYQETFDSKIRFDESCFFNVRQCLKSVSVDFEGRPVQTSKYVDDDPATRYKGLRTVDFCIENQLLVGAELPVVKYQYSNAEASYRLSELAKSMPKPQNVKPQNVESNG